MTTLEKIRQTGANIAFENEIFGNKKIEDISLSNEIVEDFIERVINDLFEFNTLEQFDNSYFNLFNRAFMYVYGKGAEVAFYSRLGNSITRINYEFDKVMQGVCGDKLSDNLRFRVNRKSSAMLDMYFKMFQHTRGSQEKIISENITFRDCISTILNGAFFCGIEICLTTELSKEDRLLNYQAENDKAYNNDTYDQKYKVDDFKMINYKIGNFNDIKDQLGL